MKGATIQHRQAHHLRKRTQRRRYVADLKRQNKWSHSIMEFRHPVADIKERRTIWRR